MIVKKSVYDHQKQRKKINAIWELAIMKIFQTGKNLTKWEKMFECYMTNFNNRQGPQFNNRRKII